jgi:hypothetical protein
MSVHVDNLSSKVEDHNSNHVVLKLRLLQEVQSIY